MRWVGLVRNVMLGREGLHRATLLDLVRDAGGADAQSFLTTGNVEFSADASEIDAVTEAMEASLERLLGRHEVVVMRTQDWLRELVAVDRFAGYDPAEWELEVSLLARSARPVERQRLPDPQRTVLVEVRDREVLTARPRSGGRRPHVNRLVERATGQQATARGWSTLTRLAGDRPDSGRSGPVER